MLLIIDCKNKITWKKLDHLQNGSVISSEGSVALEEKELLMTVENGDTVSMDKIKEEVTKLIQSPQSWLIKCRHIPLFNKQLVD